MEKGKKMAKPNKTNRYILNPSNMTMRYIDNGIEFPVELHEKIAKERLSAAFKALTEAYVNSQTKNN